MKNLKIVFASLFLIAIVSAFTVLPKEKPQKFVSIDNELVWDGGSHAGADFVIATGTKSWLSDAPNYASSFASYSGASSGSGKIAKLHITYSYTGTDPAPTIQEVINQVESKYNDVPATHVFTNNPFTFTKNLVQITVKIEEKN